jgi:hypothetical protein
MSIVTVEEFEMQPAPRAISQPPTLLQTVSNLDLNGVGHYMAHIDYMPETKTVDRVFFRISGATTGCDALVRIETVDTSTGLPTGTLVHANASELVTITSGAANYEVTFSAGSFTINRGTLIAIVIAQSSGTPVNVYMTYFREWKSTAGLPYVIDFDSTASVRLNFSLLAGLGSPSSAVKMRDLWPITSFTVESFKQGDSPNTVGNKVNISAPVRVSGAWVLVDADSTGTVKLYSTDGTTVLASAPIETNLPPTAAAYINYYKFNSSVELTSGTYYLAVEATGASNLSVYSATFASAEWRDGSPMGGSTLTFSRCTQTPTSTASWTDDTTKQAFMGLMIDGISDGAGGGGGEVAYTFAV